VVLFVAARKLSTGARHHRDVPASAVPDPTGPDASTRARDHLANERTYLAWLRTAAAVMALGLAIAGFTHKTNWATVLAGGFLVLAGTAGVVYGTDRYRKVGSQIERGAFQVGSQARAVVIASSVLIIAVVAALVTIAVGAK
jgi:putative membrane protein